MHRWIAQVQKRVLTTSKYSQNGFRPQITTEGDMISYIYNNPPTVSMMSQYLDEILGNLTKGNSVRVICKQTDENSEKQMRYFLHVLMEENIDNLRVERHVDDFFEGGLDFVVAPRKHLAKSNNHVASSSQIRGEEARGAEQREQV